jgi:Tfp pilus assembly protein PilN
MLRTNLSTRPFYNERAANVLLALLALVVFAATVFNVVRVVSLSRQQATLSAQADAAERKARDLKRHSTQVRSTIDAKALETTADASREANAIIDRRTFSWTELFNRFEATLPPNVRIASVNPTIDVDGRFIITINVVARGVDDIDEFLEALEETGGFRDVLARDEFENDEGQIEASLRGQYLPGTIGTRKAAPAAPARSGAR